MYTITKYFKNSISILSIILLLASCSKNDENEVIQIDYPSGIEDLSKKLIEKIDFASSINADTLSYEYNSEQRINTLTSSRDRYLINYNYDQNKRLISTKTTNLINNKVESESTYNYGNADELTIVTLSNLVVTDSTVWKLSEGKGIEAISTTKKGGINVVTKSIYSWNGENIDKQEVYEQIDVKTSFNNLDGFPSTLSVTINNIVDYYNLEVMESGSDFYLTKRTRYESYNEGINILRYLSNTAPILESQKIYEVEHTNLYDPERRAYFENTGYTTFNIDNQGYPLRIATGGSNSKKLDFIYEE